MVASRFSSGIKRTSRPEQMSLLEDDRFSHLNIGRIRLFGIFVHFKFLVLMLVELSLVTLATYSVYFQVSLQSPQASGWLFTKSLIAAGPFIVCFAGLGVYSSRQTVSGLALLARYVVASAIAIPMLWVLHFFLDATITVVHLSGPVALAILVIVVLRIVCGRWLDSSFLTRRVLVIGEGSKASSIKELALDSSQRGFELINVNPDLSISGSLVSSVRRHKINEVVVAFDDRRKALPVTELIDCRMSGTSVVDVLDFLERETGVITFEHLHPSWLIFTGGFSVNLFSRAAKRVFDVVMSAMLMCFCLPIMLLTCIAIKLDWRSPGPILYRQSRVGLNGKEFHILKFRSMRTDAEVNGVPKWATENDSRITKVGEILRKYRVDELPQLCNVLAGSMSLVGPRPERPVFVKKLSEVNHFYNERHRVKPGITGWAQLRFPYTDDAEGSILKLQYDMYYLKSQGFFFDLYILLQTIEVVLFGKGAR